MISMNKIFPSILIQQTLAAAMLIFSAQSASAETVHVDIVKFKFSPQQITVNAGDTVIWTNKEKRQYHNVWFKASVVEEPDYLFPDETYSRTFPETGTFNYECGPHPKMTGTVIVSRKVK